MGRTRDQGQVSVVIVTDDESHTAGEGLPKEAMEWLKNCIITVISK